MLSVPSLEEGSVDAATPTYLSLTHTSDLNHYQQQRATFAVSQYHSGSGPKLPRSIIVVVCVNKRSMKWNVSRGATALPQASYKQWG